LNLPAIVQGTFHPDLTAVNIRLVPRHLVTCALSAVTEGPLDSLAGAQLPADAYCRFLRARSEEVLFVCVSGEHGAATEQELAAGLGLSFDVLGCSSSPRSVEQTQYFVRRLEQEGYVETRSTVCERSLEPGELIEPRAASDDPGIELRERRHLFLRCSRLAEELRAWLESSADRAALAGSVRQGWLDGGIGDWRITREPPGGVPVDRTGFEGAVYDEWFNAPIAYIGSTREWAEAHGDSAAWRRWWCASEDVRLVQFMTRDEVPFHTVCFTCSLIGSREAWKLPDAVKAFDRLTYYGGGSVGDDAAFIDDAPDPFAADCWRYWLLANAPETGEESFTWEALAATVNADMAGVVARFVDRSLGFVDRHFGLVAPAGGVAGREEEELATRADASIDAITARLSSLEFRQAVSELRSAWSLAGEYFERKRPWEPAAAGRGEVALTARTCLNLIALLARLSAPVMPFSAARLLDALAVPERDRDWPARFEPELLTAGHRFRLPPSFGPIAEAEVERCRRFGEERVATLALGLAES
jgi:methionyl-tRNA synthetase